jgi:dienelactone hydrolase
MEHVAVPAGGAELAADVFLPDHARGLVVFAHGSGSSRHSPRNRRVARHLEDGGIGAVLADLLTLEEEAVDQHTGELRFDIALLADRLGAITDWVSHEPRLTRLPLGYFGASTGAGAALRAAADRPGSVAAVVSRGGRPDLAGAALHRVRAPTLFIVGGNDPVVLDLNREAMAELPRQTEARLEVVAGASHLFEEPGTLDQVADLARAWFLRFLAGSDILSPAIL